MNAGDMHRAYQIGCRRNNEEDKGFVAQAKRISINDVERFVDIASAPRVLSVVGPHIPYGGKWRDIHIAMLALFSRGLGHQEDGDSLGGFLQRMQQECHKIKNFEERAVKVMRSEDLYDFFVGLNRLLTYATNSEPSAYASMDLNRFASQVYARFEKDDVSVVSRWFNDFYTTRN